MPGPAFDPAATTQFQVNNLDYNDYVGRLAIGRMVSGEIAAGGQYTLCRADGRQVPCKITLLYAWHGLQRREVPSARAGDIIAMRLDNLTSGTSYWAFANANENINGTAVNHLWNYGLNTYGWEDTYGGGDQDYNDLTVQFDFTSAYGHGWLV